MQIRDSGFKKYASLCTLKVGKMYIGIRIYFFLEDARALGEKIFNSDYLQCQWYLKSTAEISSVVDSRTETKNFLQMSSKLLIFLPSGLALGSFTHLYGSSSLSMLSLR